MAFALKCAWKRRGISVADQPAINLSTFFHQSPCSTWLRLLVSIAEFTTILPNES